MSDHDYEKLLNINLAAPFKVVKQIIPSMKKNRYGRIVNISSIWSQISKSNRSLYTVSKSGLSGFTRALAIEYGKENILVNSISPGFTFTELTKNSLSNEEIKKLSNQIPLRRFSEPVEIANSVLFLASDMNTYITGTNIFIDGGFTIV